VNGGRIHLLYYWRVQFIFPDLSPAGFRSGIGGRIVEPVAIVTALALFQYFAFSYWVGAARVKHGVHAPAITGHPEFERSFRIQQNTVEQLIVFLPALWIFGWYVHALTAAALGLLFIVGRFVYRASYLRDPSTRSLGFGIGALAMSALLIGGLIGAVLSWI
jgi:uncharacterized MAPEG superfamily protein